MKDILFKDETGVFSYRVAGICVHNGKVLLQTTTTDPAFAFPGGHVAFGETNAQTLIREFKEELGADISVGELKWVAEIFFPWGKKPCHQICLYYLVAPKDPGDLSGHNMAAQDEVGDTKAKLRFHWVPLEAIPTSEIYPENAKALLFQLDQNVKHFIYRE